MLKIYLGNFLSFHKQFLSCKLRQILRKNLGINLGRFLNFLLLCRGLPGRCLRVTANEVSFYLGEFSKQNFGTGMCSWLFIDVCCLPQGELVAQLGNG